MKKRMLVFSIACAVLFAETSAVCGIGASAAYVSEDAGAGAPCRRRKLHRKNHVKGLSDQSGSGEDPALQEGNGCRRGKLFQSAERHLSVLSVQKR